MARPAPVEGRTLGLATKDLYGEVSLVNVFASWCVACRAEHPLFMRLARDKSVFYPWLELQGSATGRGEMAEHARGFLHPYGSRPGRPKSRSLADFRGKIVLLNVWAT
ncbi:thioredoxin domain-containing protein [Sinorhizobium meliloti]|uniref:hypothetical protein n=1 Tax=Rhizobium meliloti TaxID=382 RepID=UPI002D791644|nr:hypothetical protein [Sinorhizobium meliloti]